MTTEMVLTIARDTITTALLLALPPLSIALLVGLVISIFQAVTQVQEQTLTFVPKIVAVFLSLLVFGPWMLSLLIDFTVRIFANLGGVIG